MANIIGARIKEALEKRNMNQCDLAQLTGISTGSISCYISGRYLPKQNSIHLMAKALNVDDNWLMGFDEKVEESPYYLTPETKAIAQEIYDNKEMRELFDAALGASPKALDLASQMLNLLKEESCD